MTISSSAHHAGQLHQPEQVLQDPHAQRARPRARVVVESQKETGSSLRHKSEKYALMLVSAWKLTPYLSSPHPLLLYSVFRFIVYQNEAAAFPPPVNTNLHPGCKKEEMRV